MEFFKISKGKIITTIILILLTIGIFLINFRCALTGYQGSNAPACMPYTIFLWFLLPFVGLLSFIYKSVFISIAHSGNIIFFTFIIIGILIQIFYYYLLSCIIIAIVRKAKGK